MSETRHTDDGFVEFDLKLPKEVWAKIEPLAKASGLTIEQMVQSIFTLQMNAGGWFLLAEEKPHQEEPKGKTKKHR